MTDAPETPQPPRAAALVRAAFLPLLALVLGALVLVITRVDLAPSVSPDFFFATEDPALASTRAIEEVFPTSEQLYLMARLADPLSAEGLARVRALSDALKAIPGVSSVLSLTHGPPRPEAVPGSALWGRLLLSAEDPRSTNLVVTLGPATEDARRATLEAAEQVVARHDLPSFALEMSGVPFVVELVRRSLVRDLRTFSFAAVLVFGLLVALVYRSWRVLAGTLVSCAAAVVLTLAGSHLLGAKIGVLSANIVTIVFVLTLSHIVFLTANAERVAAEHPGLEAARQAGLGVGRTLGASFWAMATTLFGFLSLRLASAQPLRELATAGAIASAMAMLSAFGLYPRFLAAAPGTPRSAATLAGAPRRLRPARTLPAVAVIILALVAAFGLRRLDTDPSLLAFFAPGGPIYRGIARIDASGGSSPLMMVVRDPEAAGATLLGDRSAAKLRALQAAFDADPVTGVVLSLPVLLDEARRVPLARLLSRGQLVDLLLSARFEHIARTFIDPSRSRALFLLRMREHGRQATRQAVIARLEAAIASQGLEIDAVGGIYDLQAQLGSLVASSLLRGLGGLMALFVVIAALVAAEARTAAAMVFALVLVPPLLLGTMGFLGWPVDFISSPAANVALALGIDGMIHLVAAVRLARRGGLAPGEAWSLACAVLRRPILGAMAILAGGFGIFALSSFPPTRRFGLAVALGTLAAAASALLVLPRLAAPRASDRERLAP